ncbi:hypothetical protein WMY93_031616 [Mugilogobius chulae]|uniref:Uncharacterized protein n=1 Tax=Mugilogobius chulae TaxID=88201 RepID=A0AAW0MD42_9GOBI
MWTSVCPLFRLGDKHTDTHLALVSETIVSPEDEEPLFYNLEKNETRVCLATGFSRHDKLSQNDLFNGANATFIDQKSEDPDVKGLYSQVALLSSDDHELCPESPVSLEGSLQSDPTVNLVSLTVLGLRILFIKTVAFNILFTLRLCISR